MRIVLANDAELLRMLERTVVTRQKVDLVTAADPLDLLDQVTAQRPDLVVLSRRVGDTSGVELCRRLKADPATADVPILLLDTADPGIPADVCLAPPVDREALLASVCERLALSSRATPRVRSRLRVEYFGDAIEGVGYTKDLSAGGAFMRTREPLEPGTDMQVIFSLPGEQGTVRARARVARSVPHDPDSHLIAGVGVEFVRMSDRDRAEIRRFIDRGGRRLE